MSATQLRCDTVPKNPPMICCAWVVVGLVMKQNGLPTSFCFAWRSTDSDRLNVSLFMLSPSGTGAKLQISYERSKEKAQRRCGIFSLVAALLPFSFLWSNKNRVVCRNIGQTRRWCPQYKQLYYCCKFTIRRWRTPMVLTIILKDILVMAKKLDKLSIRGRW